MDGFCPGSQRGAVREVFAFVVAILRGKENGSVAGLNTQLAGLAFLFKLQGQPDVTKDFWVRQALKGYRKLGVRRDSRRPVT